MVAGETSIALIPIALYHERASLALKTEPPTAVGWQRTPTAVGEASMRRDAVPVPGTAVPIHCHATHQRTGLPIPAGIAGPAGQSQANVSRIMQALQQAPHGVAAVA